MVAIDYSAAVERCFTTPLESESSTSSEDGLDPAAVEEITGTSYEMIKRNYYKVVRQRLKEKLARRRSL